MLKKNNRRLRIESVERRDMLSATTIESEPNNVKALADAVLFDTSDNAAEVRGQISNRDDRDFFRFSAPQSGAMNISITTPNGLHGKVSVEDALGNKLFESEPNDGITSGSFNVNAGQRITMRVRGQDKTTGNYVVNLSQGSGGSGPAAASIATLAEPGNILQEVESNNTKGTANRGDLGSDKFLTLKGTSVTKDDSDFFVIRPATSGRLTVTVRRTSGVTAKVGVENQFGVKMMETEPNDGINSGSFQATAGVNYYFRLRSPGKSAAGYEVDLRLA